MKKVFRRKRSRAGLTGGNVTKVKEKAGGTREVVPSAPKNKNRRGGPQDSLGYLAYFFARSQGKLTEPWGEGKSRNLEKLLHQKCVLRQK